MSYYTRILTPSKEPVPIVDLQLALKKARLQASLEVEEGSVGEWKQIAVIGKGGDSILTVERAVIAEQGVGCDEIQEFLEEITNCQPASAVRWLQEYLPTIRTVYAFQHLAGMNKPNGQKIFDTLQTVLWSRLGGIFQADNEGFSNEQGYHILWQFGDHVRGPWNMALRTDEGQWHPFQMDLGSKEQRELFKNGKIPI